MENNMKNTWDKTWNPILGCSKISEGCENCYAIYEACGKLKNTKYNGLTKNKNWTGKIQFCANLLNEPVVLKRPHKIFVGSMCDIFHEKIKQEWLTKIFDIMNYCNHHTFLLFTKRPENIQKFKINWSSNIWLGVTVEKNKYINRFDYIKNIPVSVKFISMSPILDEIQIKNWEKINWIICACEGGLNARPANINWIRKIRDDCIKNNIPFTFKQWGGWKPINDIMIKSKTKKSGRIIDNKIWNQSPLIIQR